uniref:Peptide-O-fucosyltransferase 1 n=1 Tax=Attheya septentrionalis TaxID=420275 RepID=A0A7S2UE97_9STRA|mmetsp:Transcript_21398/g.38673  ORF Transcript_21398/g.38673 Transcript_21398/m.38673 type:complete len:438 (+) Transcript_21398:341-1654(+)
MALHRCSRSVWLGSIVLTASLGNILFSFRTTYNSNSIDVGPPPPGSAQTVALNTGVNTSQRDRTMATQKYDLIPSIEDTTTRQTTHSRYLVYFSHSGFSNQLLGLQRAAILAYSTNRTLVLPPLLPHKGDKPKIFKSYKARAAGPGCIPYKHHAKFIGNAKRDADAAGDGQLFPSFSELMDFDEIEKRSGIHFVDLPDFMNEKNHSTKFWHEGNRRKIDFDGRCTLNYTRTYPDMVKVFEDNFSTDPTIAVIGSAFIIRNRKPENLGFSDKQLFLGFPPSKKMLHIIKKMREKLPQYYHGVHIRFFDNQKFNCKDLEITQMFDSILQEAQHNFTATGETTMFVGFSHPTLKRCMTEYYINSTCNVMFLDDLMDEDSDIQSLVENVRVEKGTLYLVLDQLLIALADHIVFRDLMGGSTFQGLIKARHQYKDDILAQLE